MNLTRRGISQTFPSKEHLATNAQQLIHFSFLTLEGRSIGIEHRSPSRCHRNACQGTSDPRCDSLSFNHTNKRQKRIPTSELWLRFTRHTYRNICTFKSHQHKFPPRADKGRINKALHFKWLLVFHSRLTLPFPCFICFLLSSFLVIFLYLFYLPPLLWFFLYCFLPSLHLSFSLF